MPTHHFTVDASLLEELGERLIGRAPIALAELVKNAYDADAATCRIEFEDDCIVVSDSGFGMSEREFAQYWLRIGTTHKVDEHTSPGGRALTGSKGIGRLAAQFLADHMVLESVRAGAPGRTLHAVVDWTSVIRGRDLSQVAVTYDTRRGTPALPGGSQTGTRLTLRHLKGTWDAAALEGLGKEVWRLRSPFRRRPARGGRRPEEFDVEIEAPGIAGAQEAFDRVLRTLFSNWKARIRGTLDGGRTGRPAAVTIEFADDYPEGAGAGTTFRETVVLPLRPRSPADGPLVDRFRFEILIFKTEGRQPGSVPVAEMRAYLAEFGNVSLYDAGFRLPYYGGGRDVAGQDWLGIAVDQGRRLNASELLPERLRTQNRYMQDLPAPGRIFGAVEIDTNHEREAATRIDARPGEWLQIQPGRDRLHDNGAFAQLRDAVRFALDFYANRHRLRAVQAVERRRDQESAVRKYDRVVSVLDRSRPDIPPPVFQELRREVTDARNATSAAEQELDRRAALLAPLATAGIAAVALTHELSRETRFLDRVGARLRRLARAQGPDTQAGADLVAIAAEFDVARRRLRSLQDVFAPLISAENVEVTERLRVGAVVEQTVEAMRVLMPGVAFDSSGIPRDLRFPLGSLADWSAMLQNALANAWNAMLDAPSPHRVGFHGGRSGRVDEWLRVSDTGGGLSVSLAEAPKLFEPFERRQQISDERRSIAIGGQGLGLAIVRMIASRRSSRVAFVQPEPGYATTLELSWKGGGG